MIVDERIVSFINSMSGDMEDVLKDIEREALAYGVPIIRRETGQWLKTMLLIKKPLKVLEVGTAVGFSSIYMSRYLPEEGHITTIENWEPRISKAHDNFHRAGVDRRITLLEGDAAVILPRLKEGFDFIFMDAAKGQYINFLPDVIRLLETDGILVSDNVLQDGEVLDSRFVVDRRNRTIHSRMREYLYELTHNDKLETSILPVGDGVSLSVKVGR